MDSDDSLPTNITAESLDSDEGSWEEDIDDEEEEDDGSKSMEINDSETNGTNRIYKQAIAGPSTVGYRQFTNYKRERNELHQYINRAKRIKLEEEQTIPPAQKLLILRRDTHSFTPEHCTIIKEAIVEAICKSEPGSSSQFYSANLTKTGSAYIITCANTESAVWLLGVKMPPIDGHETYICRLSDLPKKVKVAAYFPSNNYTKEKLLDLLKKQNNTLKLNFDDWEFNSKRGADLKEGDTGTYAIILMSEEDFKILTPFGCRLFFELSTVQLKFISKAVLPLSKG